MHDSSCQKQMKRKCSHQHRLSFMCKVQLHSLRLLFRGYGFG